MIAAEELRARFDAPDALGYGLEEELFLVDHETLDELPRAREVHERTEGDPRFKLELMAAQLEIVTPPSPDLDDGGRRAAPSRAATSPQRRRRSAA